MQGGSEHREPAPLALAQADDGPEIEDPAPTALLDSWEDLRPGDAYLDLLRMARSWDKMGLLRDRVPANVLDRLPAPLPDREQVARMGDADGFIMAACPDAGDGDPHDPPKWRPYLSQERWDPHNRAWDAAQTRGKTARERWTRLAKARDEPLGILRFELTLPPDLVPDVWGEIIQEGGGGFFKLGEKAVERAWRAWDLPGEPVGAWVCLHRTSSSKPHEIRPHLHVWTPAIYRDAHGHLHQIERWGDDGDPLHRPREDLDALREAWADLLAEHYGHRREAPENAHYSYLWMEDREARARLAHGCRYMTRAHLEDVNARLLDATEDWVRLDVDDRQDLDQSTLLVDTDDFLAGVLSVQALTPKGWQMSRWYGDLSHRNFEGFADDLGAPEPLDDPTNLWDDLRDEGRAWAGGHPQREADAVLAYVREDIAHHVTEEALRDPDMDPPTPSLLAHAAHFIAEAVEHVTQPLANLCLRCGARREVEMCVDADGLAQAYRDAAGDPPDDGEPPGERSAASRRWALVEGELQPGDAPLGDRLRWDRVAYHADGETQP